VSRAVSIGVMLKQVAGLLDTRDLNEWEARFVSDTAERTQGGANTTRLTPRQVDVIERIWRKHFA
jgi:hypothetical protein